MSDVSDAALPWVLLVGCIAGGVIGGLLAFVADRLIHRGSAWLAGRISDLPIRVARLGCDDCSVENGEPHRYAGCPGNVRQIEREAHQ